MTRTIGLFAASALVVLGILHMALTIPSYGALTVDALWFAGSGLMLVSTGLLNLAVLRGRNGGGWLVWATAAVDVIGVDVDADDRVLWVPGVAARHGDGEHRDGVRVWLAPLAGGE